MDYYSLQAHRQYQKDIHAEARAAQLRTLAFQARRGTPGLYRSIRIQAGRGLIAMGRFLVDQSGDAPVQGWEMQREA